MLHESNIRPNCIITVQPAEFEMKGEEYRERKIQKVDAVDKKRIHAEKERRFAWTEEQANKVGLKIVILKQMFSPKEIKENPALLSEIEIDVKDEIESSCGSVQKVEIFQDHPEGVIKVKFFTPLSAERCVGIMRGRVFDGREIEADYWDGHTDYKRVKESDEEYERRKGEFGDWIEMQGLPEELRTRKEAEGTNEDDEGNEEYQESEKLDHDEQEKEDTEDKVGRNNEEDVEGNKNDEVNNTEERNENED